MLTEEIFRVDSSLYCFRAIKGKSAEAGSAGRSVSGAIPHRARGARSFSACDRAIVRAVHDAVAALLGHGLARFDEPTPRDLGASVRRVLACMLEGDSDKQIAKRLLPSPFTINQHVKRIYRHFGVSSRAELLARWLRRGWTSRAPWRDDEGPSFLPPLDRA